MVKRFEFIKECSFFLCHLFPCELLYKIKSVDNLSYNSISISTGELIEISPDVICCDSL